MQSSRNYSFLKVYNMLASRKLKLFLLSVYKFDDIKPANSIDAAVSIQIKISKNCHHRFAANHLNFLSST